MSHGVQNRFGYIAKSEEYLLQRDVLGKLRKYVDILLQLQLLLTLTRPEGSASAINI